MSNINRKPATTNPLTAEEKDSLSLYMASMRCGLLAVVAEISGCKTGKMSVLRHKKGAWGFQCDLVDSIIRTIELGEVTGDQIGAVTLILSACGEDVHHYCMGVLEQKARAERAAPATLDTIEGNWRDLARTEKWAADLTHVVWAIEDRFLPVIMDVRNFVAEKHTISNAEVEAIIALHADLHPDSDLAVNTDCPTAATESFAH